MSFSETYSWALSVTRTLDGPSLEMQGKYTDYTNAKRKDKIISVGDRVDAKLKHILLKKIGLFNFWAVRGRLKKRNAWNLRELSTKKLYVVRPDLNITRKYSVQNTRINTKPKPIENENNEYHDDSSDCETPTNKTSKHSDKVSPPPDSVLALSPLPQAKVHAAFSHRELVKTSLDELNEPLGDCSS